MNLLNILIILLTLIEFNECNEMEVLKKEMNNFTQDSEHFGQQMLKRITKFKDEETNMNSSYLNQTINELEKKLKSKI